MSSHSDTHRHEEAHKEHINKYKMAHNIGVAEFMRENAAKYCLDGNEMYVIGLLHDIGYLTGRREHEKNGAELLRGMGLNEQLVYAIESHGKNLTELKEQMASDGKDILIDAPQLVLLCEADMTVDARGYAVGFNERLEDIGRRYGKDGIEYATASGTVDCVKEQIERLAALSASLEIYQLKINVDRRYHFSSLNELQGDGLSVNGSNYEQVYSMPISKDFLKKKDETLEKAYTTFNIQIPEDFKGHSLSVSDVIVLSNGIKKDAFYVDAVGFQKIPDFIEQYQKAAEALRQPAKSTAQIDRE